MLQLVTKTISSASRLSLVLIVFLLCFPISTSAGELITSFEKVLKIGGEKVYVYISSVPFSPKSLGADPSTYWRVNGKHPLGGFPATPTSRIAEFYVKWGSNHYDIPLPYYEDCFDPYLRKKLGWWDNQGGTSVLPADDGKSILVEMEASQITCCGYLVQWVISNKGVVSRFVDSSIP